MIQLYSEVHEDTDLAISCRPGVKGNETLEALLRKKKMSWLAHSAGSSHWQHKESDISPCNCLH